MKFTNKIFMFLLVFILIASFGAIEVSAADTFVVAGVDRLCGSNWNPSDSNNSMTYDDGLGYYKKDYLNVPVGSYELKVVKNGNEWYGDSSGQNIKFDVIESCDITVLFNDNTKEVKFLGIGISFDVKFTYSKVAAVGSGEGPWLNGAVWNPAESSNVMIEVEKGLFEISYKDIPAGSYMFKFAFDGDWAHNFGAGEIVEEGAFCEAVYNGSNIVFNLLEDADVKLTLDIRNFDYNTKLGAVYKFECITETAQPTETPNETPTTTPSATPTEKPGDSNDSESTVVPSSKPTEKPSTNTQQPENNVETGDNSSFAITVMIAFFVISAIVLVITKNKSQA